MESAIGPSIAMEAVEDITLLMITLRMVKIMSSLNMLILPPIQPITVSAISLPAPLSEIPAAKPSEPARTHTVVEAGEYLLDRDAAGQDTGQTRDHSNRANRPDTDDKADNRKDQDGGGNNHFHGAVLGLLLLFLRVLRKVVFFLEIENPLLQGVTDGCIEQDDKK